MLRCRTHKLHKRLSIRLRWVHASSCGIELSCTLMQLLVPLWLWWVYGLGQIDTQYISMSALLQLWGQCAHQSMYGNKFQVQGWWCGFLAGPFIHSFFFFSISSAWQKNYRHECMARYGLPWKKWLWVPFAVRIAVYVSVGGGRLNPISWVWCWDFENDYIWHPANNPPVGESI